MKPAINGSAAARLTIKRFRALVFMNLCQQYLSARGITDQTARSYGLECDERIHSAKVKERLGLGFQKGYIEVIWFPIYDAAGNVIAWIARPLPTLANQPKFFCPLGSSGLPFVPKTVYGLAFGKPLLVTEGPVKALCIAQAGVDAIGINGVWGSSIKDTSGLVVIRAELQNALDWRGRKVYFAFDSDCTINPNVRHALFRLFFVLSVSGAEIFQLTNWTIEQGKGIDDFLVGQADDDRTKAAEFLRALISSASPFTDTVQSTAFDLALVKSELEKVRIPSLLREQLCKPLARKLGVKADDLREIGSPADKARDLNEPDPWAEPVTGDILLHNLAALIAKHIITEDHCIVAVALWIVLSFLINHVDIMPLLAITSPEKRCGKSRLLTLLLKLVRRPLPAVALTAATIFRSIETWQPTLLLDEADGLLKDAKGNDNLELRSIINAAHTRDFAYVPRCIDKTHEVKKFSTWAPKAIALIGRMPDSMMDRSIPISLRRKTKAETVARIRETSPEVFAELRSKIARFVQDQGNAIGAHSPTLPAGLNDRAEDCWLPLFAIADVAGGDWPTLARKAALALSADTDDADTFLTKLLRALKQDFEDQGENHDQGFQLTGDICDHLNRDKEAPWANLKNQMTPEMLARNLSRHKIKSERITLNGQQVRGFYWKKLKPVFDRFL
jgi:Protein of unknown function (DUF3631)/Domain of unknown function (DUF3854)